MNARRIGRRLHRDARPEALIMIRVETQKRESVGGDERVHLILARERAVVEVRQEA